jgi:predicted O-methyltransferase YrrM
MRVFDILKKAVGNIDSAARSLQRLEERADALVAGCANQSDLLNRKLEEVIAGLNNQSDLFNRKFDGVIVGLNNQSGLLNRKFNEVIAATNDQSALLDRQRNSLVEASTTGRGTGGSASPRGKASEPTPQGAMPQVPLLLAERTYNSSHPAYDARVVRNFPGRIFNHDRPCTNTAFQALAEFAESGEVADREWDAVLAEALVEAVSVPHAQQIFERRSFIEHYMAELGRKYRARYVPGWVNLDDALFLYWLVRRVKPETIVQTGVCNGLSAAFMMLGLVKNGPGGRLHAIDLPPVFNPNDPAWTVEGSVYGFVIPEGKASGWMVPDAYRDRFEVWSGDTKDLLPAMVDKIGPIDIFYHDSDHTYNHMMFEFHQAKRKLNQGGVVIGDDVAWNASLWDFADEFDVPSYNFKGAVGVAFF